MRSFLVSILIIIIPNLLLGQFNETIRSGRPGQAIGAYTVGKKVFQIQTGLSYNQIKNGIDETKTYLSNTVLRFGIFEKFELSGVVNWQSDNFKLNRNEEKSTGISNTQIGGRLNILERKGAIPAIGIQGRVLFTSLDRNFKNQMVGSKFILSTGNKITDWFSLGTNWGVIWIGDNHGPKSFYIINFSFGLTEKIGAFAEIYGSFNEFSVNYDFGFSYLINNDLQLDLSSGWQGNNEITNWFLDIGVSWRLHWRA